MATRQGRRSAYDQVMRIVTAKPAPPPRPRPAGLLIGRHRGQDYIIPNERRFSTHMHVIGRSGFGKSFLLYSCIVQDILAGRGVCVLDPHSELYWMLVNFLATRRIDPSRVVFINPLNERYTLKFNPLETRGILGSGAETASQAIIRAVGATDFDRTPQLGRVLETATLALEEAGEPLVMLRDFLGSDAHSQRFRAKVLERIRHTYVLRDWQGYETLTKSNQEELVTSTLNRLTPFLLDERMLLMQTFATGNLDWGEIMDEGKIVLCNLGLRGGPRMSKRPRDLLGALVMHGIGHAALEREEGARPFCVYADEFGSYASEDFADALDEYRKFGVYLTLAHQRVAQVELKNPNLMSAIHANCAIKLVFNIDYDDAIVMAPRLFTGEPDVLGDEIKHITKTVGFEPYSDWETVVTETELEQEAYSTSESETSGSGGGTAVMMADGVFFPTGTGSYVEQSNFHRAVGHVEGRSRGFTYGRSVSRVPVTKYRRFVQETGRQYRSVDEAMQRRYAQLMSLCERMLLLKAKLAATVPVPTLTIREKVLPMPALYAFEEAGLQADKWVTLRELAEAEHRRRIEGHQLVLPPIPDEPASFASTKTTLRPRGRRKPR